MWLLELITCSLLVAHLIQAYHNDDSERYDLTMTLGPAPIARHHLDVGARPGSHGCIIPQPLVSIDRTAYITNWTVNFQGTSGSIRLQIWRPRMGGRQGVDNVLFYALIGQTDRKDVAALGTGTHTFPVWPANQIRLAPNDTIGLEFVDSNPVSYSTSAMCKVNSSSVTWAQSADPIESHPTMTTLIAGRQYEFARTRPPECRVYSAQIGLRIEGCRRLRATTSGQVEQVYRAHRMDADSCWVVAPSDPGHVVRLQILQERSLDTVLVNNCSFVTMEIRIGQPAISADASFSQCDIEHYEIPFDISNKEIYIRLVTSQSTNYPSQLAISIAYSSKLLERTCVAMPIGESPAYIQSPGFPSDYPSNQDLCWVVTVAGPSRLRAEVVRSVLEEPYVFTPQTDGCIDYVEIFDGASEIEPLLARWCGTSDPGMLTASGNKMLVRFYSGPYTQRAGFKLSIWAAAEVGSTTCTKLQALPEEQFLYSPGYPHSYRHDEAVCWIVRAAHGHRVRIQVYDSRIEGDNFMCEYDVVIIRDGSYVDTPVLRRWCGTLVPREPVITTGSSAHISFHTDGSINGPGFYLGFTEILTGVCTVYGVYPYSLELLSNRLLTAAPSTTCLVLETELASHGSVRLELIRTLKSQFCRQDFIEVFDGSGPEAPLLVRWCGDVTPAYVTSSGASLYVRIVIGTLYLPEVNFRFSYIGLQQGACERVDVGPAGGTLNSPTLDMNPFVTARWPAAARVTPAGRQPVTPRADPALVKYKPNADTCTVLETSRGTSGETSVLLLRVTFMQLEGPDPLGACSNDFLEIRDGGMKTAPLLMKRCGQHSAFSVITSGPLAYIRFVSNADVQMRGFQIRYSTNSTQVAECTLISVTAVGGLLTSPGFPNTYPSLTDACWVLTVPASRRVQLTVLDFSVQARCVDYLQIFDGDSREAGLLTKVCGDGKAPDVVTSTGSALYLRFRSDNEVQSRGFQLQYRMAASGVCQHIAVGRETQTVSSPNWPLSSPRKAEFCWVLTSPGDAYHMTISVTASRLLPDPTCSQEYAQLLDGPLASSPPLLHWCGDTLPVTMSTSGRTAFLHLVTSSGGSNSSGFSLKVNAVLSPVVVSASPAALSANLQWVVVAAIAGFVLLLIVFAVLYYSYKRHQRMTHITASPRVGGATCGEVGATDQAAPTPEPGFLTGPPLQAAAVQLNSDGSASFGTAFENPGYAELP